MILQETAQRCNVARTATRIGKWKSQLLAICVLAASPVFAANLYVDSGADAGGNGSVTAPFQTIQDAVDAAEAGSTIFVAAGTYATGDKLDGFKSGSTTYAMKNRVYIDKPLTICGEDKHRTFVVGKHASTATDVAGLGLGDDAVRCIGINANNVVISNITVTGGATKVPAGNDHPDGNGGGIYAANGLSGIVIVDCIVSNNIANRAAGARYNNDATYGMTAVRCWFHANKAVNRDPVTRGIMHVHCLITHHVHGASLVYSGTFVNCTFADNYCRCACDQKGSAYNCFFADYWYKADYGGTYADCGFPIEESMVVDTAGGDCLYSIGADQFIAPVKNDWRLDASANVVGKGNMSHLVGLALPNSMKYVDFYGGAIDPDGENCNLGCCQSESAVTPAGGTLRFASIPSAASPISGGYAYALTTDNDYLFDGSREPLVCSALAYLKSAEWPVSVGVAVQTRAWKGIYGFSASGADTVMRYPYLDGTYEIVPPKDASAMLTLTPVQAASVIYVQQNSAAVTEDGTVDAPYTDLQTAIGKVAANSYGIVYCKGRNVFDVGCGSVKYNASGIANRIGVTGKNVRIVGMDGPGSNLVIGGADSSVAADVYPFGMGTDAVRCVYLAGTSAIQGFTLTGGHTADASASNALKRGAGAFLNAVGAQITDCIISNCVGNAGVAICGQDASVSTAYAFRCIIADNRQYAANGTENAGGMLRFVNCGQVAAVNTPGVFAMASYEPIALYNCSLDLGAGSSAAAMNVLGTKLAAYNCAIRLTDSYVKINASTAYGGVVRFSSGALAAESTATRADPFFADAAGGDLRLAAVSPARTAGMFNAADALYHVFIGRDFYGNPYRIENGKPLCGAVHEFAPTIVSAGTGISPSGTNVLASAGATVTYTATAARPFLGFGINGATQAVDGVSLEFTVPVEDDYSTPYEVMALYDTNWYVSDVGGNDETGTGTSAKPLKTLLAALTNAVSGDVVHVAPGVYSSGVAYHGNKVFANTETISIGSRAYVPEGVSLVSQGSSADTFIVGADASSPVEGCGGCGADAVRGVFMEKNTVLSGFTVTGGRTGAVSGENTDNVHGGGILARDATAAISDCIISNNVAQRGGGAFYGSYDRCRFLENTVVLSGNGAAARGDNGGYGNAATVKLRNCIVAANNGWSTLYFAALDNCTLAADNHQNGATEQMTIMNACPHVCNTLILGFKSVTGTVGLTNCAFTAATDAQIAKNAATTTNSCIVAASGDELRMEGFAPVIGSNIAVDAGDASLYDFASFGSSDVFGNPRAVNGARLDIGAVEAVWLPHYSRALGSAVAVTAASPAVELVAHGVKIPSGASIEATVGRVGKAGKTYVVTASVETGGTCAIEKDGVAGPTLAAGENQMAKVVSSADFMFMAFHAADAAATLSGIKMNVGMAISFK